MSMNSMPTFSPRCLSIICLILAFIIPTIHGSYCGQSAIPFSLEVRDDGQPVLGCARPACFGWNSNGKKASDSAQFYRIWGRPDGFVRVADLERERKGNWNGSLALNGPEYSICDRQYGRDRCPPGHWVGGIAPNAKIQPNSPLKLICCSYAKLANSIQSDQVEVRTGDMVQGGEMLEGEDGHEIAFEYIANIQRLFDRNGVLYVVEVRKFTCSSIPSMPSAKSSSTGMRIRATFDGDEQSQKMKEDEESDDGEDENLDQELRIGKSNGGKDEERKVLAEFSEYEGGDLQLKETTQNSLEDHRQQSPKPSTIQKAKTKYQHLHIGQIGPKVNDEQKQQKITQISSNFASQQEQQQIPIKQPINGQPLYQYQTQQQQPIPILLSQSPFGGYQMHHSPTHQQQYYSELPTQSHQISNQQLAQSQQLLGQPATIPPFFNSHHSSKLNDRGQQLKRQPLLKIPSPEEIENAIPPHGKLLLNNLARTFLGLQRLF